MRAIDGTRVATARGGRVRVVAVVGHRRAEALGWHVGTRGPRHEALQATGMSGRRQFGHPGRDAGRGVRPRHDHGSRFMAGDFQARITARGMIQRLAVIGQRRTRGVAGRFFRTLKEKVVRGRAFATPPERSATPCAPSSPAAAPNGGSRRTATSAPCPRARRPRRRHEPATLPMAP